MAEFLFYLFAAGTLFSAANVVLRREAVPAAVWLVVCFFFLAGDFLLLGASFLAAVQIMVYVGAIMVLFLFVIMLLDLRGVQPLQGQARQATAWGLCGVIGATAVTALAGASPEASGAPGLDELVKALFTTYMLPFELTSVLLVAAIVGALTLGRSPDKSRQESPQLERRTIRLVDPLAQSAETADESPTEPSAAEESAEVSS